MKKIKIPNISWGHICTSLMVTSVLMGLYIIIFHFSELPIIVNILIVLSIIVSVFICVEIRKEMKKRKDV